MFGPWGSVEYSACRVDIYLLIHDLLVTRLDTVQTLDLVYMPSVDPQHNVSLTPASDMGAHSGVWANRKQSQILVNSCVVSL